MRNLLFIALGTLLIIPLGVYAQENRIAFHTLPGLSEGTAFTTDQYVNALYALAISLAAILAVFKLILAGVRYMLTDIVTDKKKAKDDIRGALLGLVIILAAVTILNTINPNLTSLNFLRNAAATTPIQSAPEGFNSRGRTVMWNSIVTPPATITSEYARCRANGGSPVGGNLGGEDRVVCYQQQP